MSYPPPPPPPRRRFGVKWIVLTIVAAVVVCCGGVAIGGYFLFSRVSEGPRNATTAFVENLKAEEWGEAYYQLCSSTRSSYSREEFAEYAQTQPRIQDHSITGFNVETTNGQESATVRTALDLADGSSDDHTFQLVKEGEDWLVCGQPY